ncbi:MAG: gamma-glutamyl-gamma-aminobutyrate hydrolase family protein [Planctomycetota bacterium]
MPRPPFVAITSDLIEHNGLVRLASPRHYADAVTRAGGVPVVLSMAPNSLEHCIDAFDAFILTGGDDPVTEPFGQPTHDQAVRIYEERQTFETQLLERLQRDAPDKPALGVCLGMQMMALLAGGRLDQHMPETTPTHADHWGRDHEVLPEPNAPFAAGAVHSKHRQAVDTAGALAVAARAHDGVIEAIHDPDRRFYLGVQWHPERTANDALGDAIIRSLVEACAG